MDKVITYVSGEWSVPAHVGSRLPPGKCALERELAAGSPGSSQRGCGPRRRHPALGPCGENGRQ